ncbi:tellurite resistance TerB family protein [Pseudorhodobacter sp. E13]|uniref:DUF533 domain-containing protein n=1 Tax=Pseudorhodobacter sp. E13 TaxID=2487931 RepID=UPI000F8E5070|nr:DUF533 domain-containing protein [Pseudorhodobacter sp. E13]RUS60421.1 tellurite resistance TerB family protein [Pseudorhodobacter sp. E13]
MSLVSTLAKVAIGVAIAKGVSHVSKNGLPGGAAGSGRSYAPQTPGGLGDMMGSILGPKSGTSSANQGGLGGLLDQLAGQSGAKRPTTSRKAPPSGLEDLLGSLTGAQRGAAGGSTGGLGDMLGGLLGGGAAAGGLGGLGGMLNDVMNGQTPKATPNATQEAAAGLMLKAMVQAAKSDGKLDQAEKQKLMQSLGDADPKELDFVNALLAQPVDIAAFVDEVPRGMEEQVYLMSLMAIDLDSQSEAQYLHDLASALGFDKAQVNQIHDQAGAQRLYA